MTFLDAVTGFNQVINTPRARQMLAIIARSGQFLPICLTFGPVNGPEDFAYVGDRNFAPDRDAKRRYCNEWLAYVDDLTVRTGRCVDGVLYNDSEVKGQLKEAVEAQGKMQIHWGGQPPEDALAALGFNVDKLGAEAYLKPAKQAPRQRALARPRSKPSSAPASAVEP